MHRALNALLPGDCWIESVRRMRDGFHARKCAEARDYRYDIGCDAASHSPFRRRFEWALDRTLAFGQLEAAAANLTGEHDFTAFAVRGTAKPHARCRIRRAIWELRDGRGVRFRVTADRFLHHMVRMLVGTMVDIGLGRRPLDDMTALLQAPDNQATSPPAPPQGLYFVAAEYAADWYLEGPA
jgi:tRNA pseudouridine38-40 synthase